MRTRQFGGRRLAAVVVLALTVAGGGAAYAATAGHHKDLTSGASAGASAVAARAGDGARHFGHPGRGFGGDLSAAASYLGLSAEELRTQLRSGKTLAQIAQATDGKTVDGLVAAMVDAAKQKLAAAVSAGKLTQAQADTIGAQLKQRITDLVNGQRPARPAQGPGHGFGGKLSPAASYLGLSADELRTQLRSGKTLAQIAQATDGKTVDGLVAAMVDAVKQKLAAAVSAGKLTQAQADTIGAQLKQRITDLVNGQRPARPSLPPPGTRGPIHGGHGFGFGFGGAPPSGTTT